MSDIELPTLSEIRASTIKLSEKTEIKQIYRVRDNLAVKCGVAVKPLEADTIAFVADNTNVQVPKVHGTLTDETTNEHFIVMDLSPGETLESLMPSLSKSERLEIALLIKEALAELRNIPDPGYLGGVRRSPITHDMFWTPEPADPRVKGPFENEAAFNQGLLLRLDTVPSMTPAFRKLISDLFTEALKGHKTVFTHGDLQPKNILVQRREKMGAGGGQFKITLIDWEDAGWYPEYWEYCQAIVAAQFRSDWLEMVQEIMPTYGYEYAVMQVVFHVLYY